MGKVRRFVIFKNIEIFKYKIIVRFESAIISQSMKERHSGILERCHTVRHCDINLKILGKITILPRK